MVKVVFPLGQAFIKDKKHKERHSVQPSLQQ